MVIIKKGTGFIGIGIRGRIGKPLTYGEKIFGTIEYGSDYSEHSPHQYGVAIYATHQYGESLEFSGIYQTRHIKGKSETSRMKFSEPKYQDQPKKVIRQGIFRAGMSAWHALTESERLAYHSKGTKCRMHGHNVFLKKYLKSH